MDDLERTARDAARAAGGEYRPKYNGWLNRETWNTHLWITNDPGTYDAAREIVASESERQRRDMHELYPDWSDDEITAAARSYAADTLRDWWDEYGQAQSGQLAADYAGPMADAWSYTIACVDWRAIVDALTDE